MAFLSRTKDELTQPIIAQAAARLRGNEGWLFVDPFTNKFNFYRDHNTPRPGELEIGLIYGNNSTVEIYDKIVKSARYHYIAQIRAPWHQSVFGPAGILSLDRVNWD